MIGSTIPSAAISRTSLWTGRIIGAWLVLFLAFDAIVKILRLSVAVEGTTRLGYPEHLIVILGIVELVCLIAYVMPRTATVGAILLTGYLGGATATQVRVENPWFLLPVVLGAWCGHHCACGSHGSVCCCWTDHGARCDSVRGSTTSSAIETFDACGTSGNEAAIVTAAFSPEIHRKHQEVVMSLKDPNVVNRRSPKRIAIIISNPGVSTTTRWPVGFWWSELAHPYLCFHDKGYAVEIFSPDGGKCDPDALSDPRDPSGYSADDLISMGFIATPKLATLVENTRKAADIDVTGFDAIVVAGGQGPMFTFETAIGLQRKLVEFYEAGKITCALCHGVAVLRYATLSSGDSIAKGKTLTGFANVEEDFADNAVWSMNLLSRDKHVMPWRIEDEMKRLGANYVQGGLWRGFAVRDGNLITGQQNFSGTETAELVVRALGE